MNNYELDDVEIQQTSGLMKQINEQIDKLLSLKRQLDDLAEKYKEAEDKYIEFSRTVMPSLFHANGIDSLQATDGRMISIVTKTSCSVNKNAKDKNNVADWLRSHEAEELVKSELRVPESQLEKVKAAGIIYEEETTMNTNSIKAFLLGALGQKGSPATITVDELPKGLNFYQWDEVEITGGKV